MVFSAPGLYSLISFLTGNCQDLTTLPSSSHITVKGPLLAWGPELTTRAKKVVGRSVSGGLGAVGPISRNWICSTGWAAHTGATRRNNDSIKPIEKQSLPIG